MNGRWADDQSHRQDRQMYAEKKCWANQPAKVFFFFLNKQRKESKSVDTVGSLF